MSARGIVRSISFIERRLSIGPKTFKIVPNGGSGDCLFKAIGQATEGTELRHSGIREEVVDFIATDKWNKFKEAIEAQHVSGNKVLQKAWTKAPVGMYISYMSNNGTLGSSAELHAAGELFRFNLVMVQEYVDAENHTSMYRVENCCPFPETLVSCHYFYFTGDFDNGHWEFIEPSDEDEGLDGHVLPDGLHSGKSILLIQGVETTMEEWLKINTYNTNDEFELKHSISRIPSKRSPHPFESPEFKYKRKGSVILNGNEYIIHLCGATDLFSALLQNIKYPDEEKSDHKALAARIEDEVLRYRMANFSLVNYKLITQPHSHGFDVETLKYLSISCKGNIQDLVSAACIFGFSFQVLLKAPHQDTVKSCRFTHVDRWGGETERTLYFFMRVVHGVGTSEQDVMSKWWNISPMEYSGANCSDPKFEENSGDGINTTFHRGERVDRGQESVSESGDDVEEKASNERSYKAHHHGQDNALVEGVANDDTSSDQETSICLSTPKENRVPKRRDHLRYDRDNNRVSSKSKENRRSVRSKSGGMGRHNLDDEEDATSDEGKPEKDLQEEKSCKTVVEVHDGITNKKRKYVFEGHKTKEEVLQVLKAKGFVKDVPRVILADDESSKPPKYTTPRSESEQSIREIPLNRNLGAKTSGRKYSTVSIHSSKLPKNQNRVKKGRDKSCAIMLAKEDSKERQNQFSAMHQRVSPLHPRPKKKKGFALRFLAALLNLCFKKSKPRYSNLESGNETDKV